MTASPYPTPHFALRDLGAEAIGSILARPGRSVLTVLGTVLGIGAIVATLGISKTAGNQIVTQFDALAATSVSVSTQSLGWGYERVARSAIPWDAQDRLERLNGVVAAGTLSPVSLDGALTRSAPINDPGARNEFAVRVFAVSPGLFDVAGAELRTGRFFDTIHSDRSDRVAVLGPGAAERLNIDRVDHQPAIFVGEELLIVIGVLEDVAYQPSLLNAIVVPNGAARELFGLDGVEAVHVRTEVGAAQLIAEQAPVALQPNDPEALVVSAPIEPEALRAGVEEDVNALFVALGGISLLIGAIGIANVTLVSVLERVGEIGLRRSLGAAKWHIAGQFLTESAAMGFIGGILGASLGTIVVVAVSALRLWTPVIDPWVPLGAPLLGAVVGLLAGLYPAWRASALEPVDALRAGL